MCADINRILCSERGDVTRNGSLNVLDGAEMCRIFEIGIIWVYMAS
jgi:hypothetical protein